MDKHTLTIYINKGYSQYKIAELEKCSQTKIGRWLRKFGLSTQKHTKETLHCLSCNNALEKNELKFCSNACQGNWRKNKFVEDIKNGVTPLNPERGSQLRRYVLRTREHRCSICNETTWQGKEIPLIVDHIDGNYENTSDTNIRLVCPNCDAQLPTYMGKNRGKGRHKRRERYSKGLSF